MFKAISGEVAKDAKQLIKAALSWAGMLHVINPKRTTVGTYCGFSDRVILAISSY